MNANAEIIVNQKQDILMVPLEAVQKFGNRYFVFVKAQVKIALKKGKVADFSHREVLEIVSKVKAQNRTYKTG